MATAISNLMMAGEDLRLTNNCIQYYKYNKGKKGSVQAKNYAAFHLQQAIEKIVKFQILVIDVSVQNNRWFWSHDIIKLVKCAKTCGIIVNVPKEVIPYLRKISEWVGGARYGDLRYIRIETVEKIFLCVVSWYKSFK